MLPGIRRLSTGNRFRIKASTFQRSVNKEYSLKRGRYVWNTKSNRLQIELDAILTSVYIKAHGGGGGKNIGRWSELKSWRRGEIFGTQDPTAGKCNSTLRTKAKEGGEGKEGGVYKTMVGAARWQACRMDGAAGHKPEHFSSAFASSATHSCVTP